MRRVAVVLLVMAGCRDHAAPPRPRVRDARPAPIPADAGPDPRADVCDLLLPPALRQAHFPGLRLTEEVLPRDLPAAGCLLDHEHQIAHVYVMCADEAGYPALIAYARQQLTGVADVAVGRLAFTATSAGATFLQLWDDDAPCLATINGYAGDAIALGRAMTVTVTPAIGARIHALGPR